MGSSKINTSKKHREKDRKKHRRSRSRSKERDHPSHRKHTKSTHKEKRRRVDQHDSDIEEVFSSGPKPVQSVVQSTSNASKNDEPETKGSSGSLSITETNKLRAKLGLKPLQIENQIPGLGAGDGQTEASQEEVVEIQKEEIKEVFVKTHNMRDKIEADNLREKIRLAKERRKITEKLSTIKKLGESDGEGDEDNPLKWIEKSRALQVEKDRAAQRAKMLEEMDQEFGVAALVEEEFISAKQKSYSRKDLKGLSVGHDSRSFKDGEMIILTLKDQGVLGEEEDVLINVNMIDDEKANQNIENKKRKPDYEAYEEPEYDEFGIVKKRSMLYKYDEELDGLKKQSFKLGTKGMDREKELELIRMKLKQKQGVTLEMPALKIANEYLTPDEMVQFKKPKKKRKVMRKRTGLKPDDILPLPGQKVGVADHGSRNRKDRKDEAIIASIPVSSLVNEPEIKLENPGNGYEAMEENELMGPDEDLTGVSVEEDKAEQELELALSRTRKLKLHTGLNNNGNEEMALKIKSEPKVEDETDGTGVSALPTGKASTSEGVINITLNSVAEFCRTLGDIPTYGLSGNREEDIEDMMELEDDMNAEEEWRNQGSYHNGEEPRGNWNQVEIQDQPAEITKERENEPILEEEPDVSTGLAGALKLAMKKGYLENDNVKLTGASRSSLQAQSYTIEEKFYEDDKFGRRDRYTGPVQDFREKETYRPEVKLEYIDDNGRLLCEKEAFRYLSHKFHGKGPGKNKVDKRTKKLDQEGKLKQMSSTDTPLNTLKLLQEKQKDLQTPYILLSGGGKALTQTSITKSK